MMWSLNEDTDIFNVSVEVLLDDTLTPYMHCVLQQINIMICVSLYKSLETADIFSQLLD